ncbi:uncharacterized protein VTP21DRAFT_6950 [Calcarisporiella thermophila]|uniref:uncharacterized protein n=1 Tax=Calcarisporiella thermophila TaxID=911321 RepID=UPI003743D5AB
MLLIPALKLSYLRASFQTLFPSAHFLFSSTKHSTSPSTSSTAPSSPSSPSSSSSSSFSTFPSDLKLNSLHETIPRMLEDLLSLCMTVLTNIFLLPMVIFHHWVIFLIGSLVLFAAQSYLMDILLVLGLFSMYLILHQKYSLTLIL